MLTKLFNARYGSTGQTSYGADGLLYRLVPSGKGLGWERVENDTNTETYRTKLKTMIDQYQTELEPNVANYQKSIGKTGWPTQIDLYNKSQYQLSKNYHKLLSKLFPKRYSVNKFGRKCYLDTGFATYLLLRVLHYYGISLDKIGLKAQSRPYKDLSGIIFFNLAMKFVDKEFQHGMHQYTKVLMPDELDIWTTSTKKLTWPQKIRTVEKMLAANIESGYRSKTSSKYLVLVKKIHHILKKIIRFNIVKKSTHLQYYFDLFRLLKLDLVSVVHFLRKLLPAMTLKEVPGTIHGKDIHHCTGLSQTGFGYGLYYLIENEYINEHTIWDWFRRY